MRVRDPLVAQGDDGRPVYTFTQSWLNNYHHCPESGRLEIVGEMPRWESDSAAAGTAVHEAAEVTIDSMADDGVPLPMQDGLQIAFAKLDEIMADPNFRWIKFRKRDQLVGLIDRMFPAWYEKVLPTLGKPIATEYGFKVTLHEDDQRVIRVQGSIDYIGLTDDPNAYGGVELRDWKTASRRYDEWEYQRYKVQPTVYSVAAAIGMHLDELPPFRYGVMLHNGDVQKFTVQRTWGHVAFLVNQLLVLCAQIEEQPPEWSQWPLGDQGWWCSEKWCPAWAKCKGAALSADTAGCSSA